MAIIPTCVLTSVIDEVLTPCEWFHTVRAYDIQMKIEIQFTFRKIIIISTEWIFGNQMKWDEWNYDFSTLIVKFPFFWALN